MNTESRRAEGGLRKLFTRRVMSDEMQGGHETVIELLRALQTKLLCVK